MRRAGQRFRARSVDAVVQAMAQPGGRSRPTKAASLAPTAAATNATTGGTVSGDTNMAYVGLQIPQRRVKRRVVPAGAAGRSKGDAVVTVAAQRNRSHTNALDHARDAGNCCGVTCCSCCSCCYCPCAMCACCQRRTARAVACVDRVVNLDIKFQEPSRLTVRCGSPWLHSVGAAAEPGLMRM